MPPPILVAFAVGLLLAGSLLAVARKDFSADSIFWKVLFGLSGAYFFALTVASVVGYFFVPRYSVYNLLYTAFGTCFAVAATASFGFLRFLHKADESVASLSAPGDGSATVTSKPLVRASLRVTRRSGARAASAADVSRSVEASDPPSDVPLVRDGDNAAYWRTAVIYGKGALDGQTVAALAQHIEKACSAGPVKLVLDLTEVTSLDLAGVEGIVDSYRRFSDSHFSIVAPEGGAASRALKLLGVDQVIPIERAPSRPRPVMDTIKQAEAVTQTVPEAATETVTETVPEAVTETVPEAATQTVTETVPEVATEIVHETVPEAATETAATEIVHETMPQAATETVHETAPTEIVHETVPEAAKTVPEPATETVHETAATETLPEAATETVPETVHETVPTETVHEPATETVHETVPTETVPEAATQAVPEAVTETVPEEPTEAVPEVVTETVPEAASEAETGEPPAGDAKWKGL